MPAIYLDMSLIPTDLQATWGDTFRRAVEAWECKEVPSPQRADITVVVKIANAFTSEADRQSNRIAQTDKVGPGKFTLTYDSRTKWKVASRKSGFFDNIGRVFARGSCDLLVFALHELGHALGINRHVSASVDFDSVMQPSPESLGLVNHPSDEDLFKVRSIWR